ncbi:SGNH/GDSL hydrolase family protein [Wenyingzhuangia sp. 2_MG-2023]|uniref:SGNH/GDSL hydrolase family protein n=1 Tax=Wenyingzhuangia sp. 2_MG-2023 TaxID=3062639 RepID=UPI0026E2A614|nr:SGNH/GDSL hydrolase family protein [Wenyingzhuangia sp. 2_MG-2023]MDO6737087.1 SGNH/GDSL hydrolase family protein [Wenyingzhuangia sp. 2_MG-2023]
MSFKVYTENNYLYIVKQGGEIVSGRSKYFEFLEDSENSNKYKVKKKGVEIHFGRGLFDAAVATNKEGVPYTHETFKDFITNIKNNTSDGSTIDPSTTDLDEFKNESVDPFAKQSDLEGVTIDPTQTDLSEFNNEALDPFAKKSEVDAINATNNYKQFSDKDSAIAFYDALDAQGKLDWENSVVSIAGLGDWVYKAGETDNMTIKVGEEEIVPLTILGYVNSSGGIALGSAYGGARISEFRPVEKGNVIVIKDAIKGSSAKFCTLYSEEDDASYVITMNEGGVVPSDGYVVFCADIFEDDSFIIQKQASTTVVDTINGEATFTPTNLGYIETDGTLLEANVGHYYSDFIRVDSKFYVSITEASKGGAALFCAFYTEKDDTTFVKSLVHEDQIPSEGYVVFCGQTYTDSSFKLYATKDNWNKETLSIKEGVVKATEEKTNDAIPNYRLDNAVADIYVPSWEGKVEMRETDVLPSVLTQGKSYLYDNGGSLELRVVVSPLTIATFSVGSILTPYTITPFTGSWYASGDSITYGVGATTKFIDRVVTKLNADGHNITVTNGGRSGSDADGVYLNLISNPKTSHDIASLMIGMNDIAHWFSDHGATATNRRDEEFREWYRVNLNKLIDLIITQTSCSKFFLIVPTPQVISFDGSTYLPTEDRYHANGLMQIVIQECVRAWVIRKGDIHLCRGDYYLKDATTALISDGIHPNDSGAEKLAIGVHAEMTTRI